MRLMWVCSTVLNMAVVSISLIEKDFWKSLFFMILSILSLNFAIESEDNNEKRI
ncbi:MAG: hypothetical protein IIC75_09305 [Bacteroidetes bacterium]|nr:hypothetical protein [Bacteroidota bacterium]